MAEKIVLGMSGGVDSAVAALRLKEAGYEVYGLFLELGHGGEQEASQAADELSIPLHVVHCRETFEQQICVPFAEAFRHASTPNPCVVCNPKIKFHALTNYADEIGAANIATGHYARTAQDGKGRALLLRAQTVKDQSYMLYRLSRETIARCLFPLGDAADKTEIRETARRHHLSAAALPDSMDVCFIPDGDTGSWLERHGAACPPGNFVDPEGHVLGRHKGLHRYTVGQRKGLGVSAAGRLFVQELRPASNEIVLSLEDIFRTEITVEDVHYIAPEYASRGAFPCSVRVRFSQHADAATVWPEPEARARVVFDTAVRAPAKGQSAVFYDGDIVIGGGFIMSITHPLKGVGL